MMRGTFANIRIRNEMLGGIEGGYTRLADERDAMSVYDAAMKYQAAGTPLVIVAGVEYGTGSSRDWAAKGSRLLGIRAVIAESFERIHRSNLAGMGVLRCVCSPRSSDASARSSSGSPRRPPSGDRSGSVSRG
jgi:aconitate hydratase